MSKSDESDASRINMTDSKDIIISKILKAKTDSLDYISYEESRPELQNLLRIFSEFTSEKPEAIASLYHSEGFAKFKRDLAELVAEKLYPINKRYAEFMNDKIYLLEVLSEGKNKAAEYASKTLKTVKEEFGFLNL